VCRPDHAAAAALASRSVAHFDPGVVAVAFDQPLPVAQLDDGWRPRSSSERPFSLLAFYDLLAIEFAGTASGGAKPGRLRAAIRRASKAISGA